MNRFLLSTGGSTTKIEKYILDLFRINMNIYPGEVPNSDLGFDFVLTNTKKVEVVSEIKNRLEYLVRKIEDKVKAEFMSSGISISLGDIQIFDETRVSVEINVNDTSENFELEI